MDEKKAETAETPEDQPATSSTVVADGGSKSRAAVAEAETEPARSGGTNGARANATAEKTPGGSEPDQSLGTFLTAARERRGFSAEDVVRETRLPANYLRMMETNDYSEISDQLYLVPFLRRYASFLELDQEDVAMRFVREVQRADSIPPARLDQPLVAEPRRRRGWGGALLVIGFLAIAAGVYLYESNWHRQASANIGAPHAIAGAAAESDSAASTMAPQPPASH